MDCHYTSIRSLSCPLKQNAFPYRQALKRSESNTSRSVSGCRWRHWCSRGYPPTCHTHSSKDVFQWPATRTSWKSPAWRQVELYIKTKVITDEFGKASSKRVSNVSHTMCAGGMINLLHMLPCCHFTVLCWGNAICFIISTFCTMPNKLCSFRFW